MNKNAPEDMALHKSFSFRPFSVSFIITINIIISIINIIAIIIIIIAIIICINIINIVVIITSW